VSKRSWTIQPWHMPRDVALAGKGARAALMTEHHNSAGEQYIVADDAVVLDEFIVLADAPDREILAFAKKYGVLGLCQHGLPFGHPPLEGQTALCRWARRERLSVWRLMAREAGALRNLARELRSADELRRGARDDWRRFVEAYDYRRDPSSPANEIEWRVDHFRDEGDFRKAQSAIRSMPIAKWRERNFAKTMNRRFSRDDLRSYVADQVNRMLEHASVRPALEWGPRYPMAEASLEVGTGVGAIVAHALMREVASRRGPVLCACGKMLPPEISRRGRPSIWCRACRADNEDGAARQRRLKAKRKSHAS